MTLQERLGALTQINLDTQSRYYTDFSELKEVTEALRSAGKELFSHKVYMICCT